jgi:hypothetical protein
MTWLCATGMSAYFWPSPFWTLPTLTLTASAAAVSIGFINMLANLAGYLGNHFYGWLRGHNATDTHCLLFLAACYLLGGIFISFINLPLESSVIAQPLTPTHEAHSTQDCHH